MTDSTLDPEALMADAEAAGVGPYEQTTLAARAQSIATRAHHGQTDKAGRPYITHPARIAARVQGDDTLEAVAWLHDVVEDTPVTLDDLRDAGFPEAVVAAVHAITRRTHEAPDDYYDRVRANETALRVKAADIADNSDPARLALLDEPTRQRLTRKYAHARHRLGLAPEEPPRD